MALTLAPSVRHYIATDQEYVQRRLRENLEANASVSSSTTRTTASKSKGSRKQTSKPKSKSKPSLSPPHPSTTNITFTTLDWETDMPASLKDSIEADLGQEECGEEDKGFDLLISCDCIYNEALVPSFVRTCADICRLRPVYCADGAGERPSRRPPSICLIAQQQRSPDVFETWLRETMRFFHVWRVGDEVAGEKLRLGSGYLVHLLLLRQDAAGV